jgi:hypothetical protein
METLLLETLHSVKFATSFKIITPHGDGNQTQRGFQEQRNQKVLKSLPLTGMETSLFSRTESPAEEISFKNHYPSRGWKRSYI